MNSMTGYGRASINHEDISIVIEISSVNKRHLEVVVSAPKEWQKFEYDATKYIKSFFERGRIRVALSLVKNPELQEGILSNQSLIEKDLDRLKNFLNKKQEDFVITPELILQLSNLRKNETELPPLEEISDALLTTLGEASHSLAGMRENEGSAIKDDLLERILRIKKLIIQIEKKGEGMADEYKEKLLERLKKSGLSLEQDDDRVLKEIAIFAEKSDISEEITRLKSHLVQMTDTLEIKGSIGRKIEFILQEISRELNTFCSKSTRTECTRHALDARTEVGKMREQSLNIE